jgi:hypothetical protein
MIISFLIHNGQSKQFNYEKKSLQRWPLYSYECTPKTKTASVQNVPAEVDGHSLDSSANIDYAFKSTKCIE